MNYNYLIVEDNPGCVQNLQIALKSHKAFLEAGIAPTLSKGISLTITLKPHLIFLDVQLGKENGLDLIKEIRQHTTDFPFIIMMTDFIKYGKDAVNTEVLYFLDKPIDPDELSKALHKFENRVLELQNHITIKTTEGYFFIDHNSIQYIKSMNNYSVIHRVDEKPMVVTRTLKDMAASLPSQFVRIHKSHLVNRRFVQMMNTRKKIVKMKFNGEDSDTALQLDIGNKYLDDAKRVLLNR